MEIFMFISWYKIFVFLFQNPLKLDFRLYTLLLLMRHISREEIIRNSKMQVRVRVCVWEREKGNPVFVCVCIRIRPDFVPLHLPEEVRNRIVVPHVVWCIDKVAFCIPLQLPSLTPCTPSPFQLCPPLLLPQLLPFSFPLFLSLMELLHSLWSIM